MMNELEKLEFEIEKVKSRLIQFKRVSEIMELPKDVVEHRINEMLEELSELIKQKEKLTK